MMQGHDGKGQESSMRPMEMPAVKTTIVGGRPPGSGKMLGEIPRGIEVLVKKASVDAAFRALLMARRAKAADQIGLQLAPAEAIMLDHVPTAQLEAIINRTKVDPSRRNAFLSKAAGVMLAALGASAVVSDADAGPTKGVRPDGNSPVATQPATQPATRPTTLPVSDGIRPDTTPREVAGARATVPETRPATGAQTPPAEAAPQRPEEVMPVAGERAVPAPARPVRVPVLAGDRITPPEPQPTSRPAASGPTASQPASTQAASQPALSPAEIDALVTQLADNKYEVREAAHKTLQGQGLAILPALRQALQKDNLDPEARTRLESIVAALAATTRPARPPEIRVMKGLQVLDHD